MKRNIILFILLFIFSVSFWIIDRVVYSSKPELITDLEYDQTRYNEKLITAQILSESLDRVYAIFENNLVVRSDDKRLESASMDFLDTLTDILEKLDIPVLHIKPKPKSETKNFTYVPYELEIKCSFDNFGKFITELEKNDRLISIDMFTINNRIERISNMTDPQELSEMTMEMEISTITLTKNRG